MVVGQDLHVTAEGLVTTGVSQVAAGLGTCCDPISAHQYPVQAHKKGSPLRRSLSRTSVTSGDRWAMTSSGWQR